MDTWTSIIPIVNELDSEAAPQSLTPMQVANLFERRSKQKKRLAALVKKVNAECARLEQQVMDLIEAELLPPSFKGKQGSSIYTREETWASPADGDHARLTEVLRSLGDDYAEYLPSNVNSQSLSSLVRNSWNEETEQYDLPPDLINALKITRKPRVVSNG